MIAIIGAGISGLSAAWQLEKKGVDYILLEGSDQPGGYISSVCEHGYVFDQGPNSILCDEEILSFIKEAGLEKEIVYSNEVSKNRYIYKEGKYRKLPSSPVSLLSSNFFSWLTKLSIFTELWRKGTGKENETLADFFNRRFGKEVTDYALNPFVSGIYAGNPAELLVKETFPSLLEYERKYGSVLKGFIKNASGERKKSINFKKGMQALTDALAFGIKHKKYNYRISDIKFQDGKYHLSNGKEEVLADKLIITIPAFTAAELLKNIDPGFSNQLKQIQYPPMILVHTVFKKKDVKAALNGFGALNPKVEKCFTAGSIWTSSVFSNRCPEDEVMFTSFVGGAQYILHTIMKDDFIKQEVCKELSTNFKILNTPVLQRLTRWEKAIPQYDSHILAIKENIKSLESKSIFVCANWHGGVSLTDCIKKGNEIARRISGTHE